MNGKDVSLYILCSGSAGTLRFCLDGLMTQTLAPGRVIVIDNACAVPAAIDDYIAARMNVAIRRLPSPIPDSELPAMALRESCGQLTALISPGLIPAPDWLEYLAATLEPACCCMKDKAARFAGALGCSAPLNPQADNNAATGYNGLFKTGLIKELCPTRFSFAELDKTLGEHNYILINAPSAKCGGI